MEKTHARTRRGIVAALLITGMLTAMTFTTMTFTTAPSASAARRVPRQLCKFDWKKSDRQVKRTIRCAVRRWHVRGGVRKAMKVARRESGFEPRAYNSAGPYLGVYQHVRSYWPSRARQMGLPGKSAFNGRANVIVSIRMVNKHGWGPWGG
ncbi:MAG: hypothetical protein WD206_02800 [Actinomycetota bacterium]